MIGKCKYCGDSYCMECSKHKHWKEFCSDDCYDEYTGNENKPLLIKS